MVKGIKPWTRKPRRQDAEEVEEESDNNEPQAPMRELPALPTPSHYQQETSQIRGGYDHGLQRYKGRASCIPNNRSI